MPILRSSRALAVLLGAGLAVIVLANCGSDGGGGTLPTVDASPAGSVAVVVGANGGTVATADGNASVEIPPGALPGDTVVTIAPSPPSTPAPPDAATVGPSYTFGPSGLVFLKPITLTLGFDPAAVTRAHATPSAVVALTAPDGSSAYESLPTTLADAAHIATTTNHFTTYVAAIENDDAGPITDATTDSGAACYVECMSSSVGDPEGGDPDGTVTGCTCQSRCGGHAYATTCTGTQCSCTKDGVVTGNATVAACGDGYGALGSHQTGCGYPGIALPASTCAVTCDFQYDAGAADDADPDSGGTSIASCSCSSTCATHAYAMTCDGKTCACKADGVTTESWPDSPACNDPLHAFHYDCHFVGSFPEADGGTD